MPLNSLTPSEKKDIFNGLKFEIESRKESQSKDPIYCSSFMSTIAPMTWDGYSYYSVDRRRTDRRKNV